MDDQNRVEPSEQAQPENGPAYLANELAVVEIDLEEGAIHGRDLTDGYNEPSFYNTTRRSIRKAARALRAAWTDEMTMRDAERVLNDNGVRTRNYCAVD